MGRSGRGGENDQNILYKILEELIGKKNYKCTWNREEFSPPQKQKTKLKKINPQPICLVKSAINFDSETKRHHLRIVWTIELTLRELCKAF